MIGFRFVNQQPRFIIEYVMKNIGQTPAIDVTFFMSMAFGDQPKRHLDETINHFETAQIQWKDAILFPGDELERKSSCDHSGEPPPRILELSFYVVAAYQTVFSKRPKFTPYLYDIVDRRRDDGLNDPDNAPHEITWFSGATNLFSAMSNSASMMRTPNTG